jgi:hypothetical protein
MRTPPTADEVRAMIRPLTAVDRKVIGGITAWMMAEPQRVRDREWIAQRFVEIAAQAIAGAAPDEDGATTDDVEQVRAFAQTRMPDLMAAATAVFVRTADDLRLQGGPVTMERASAIVRGYLEA